MIMKNNKSGVRDGGWALHSQLPVYRTRKCLAIRVISNDLGETYVSINLATYKFTKRPYRCCIDRKGRMKDSSLVCGQNAGLNKSLWDCQLADKRKKKDTLHRLFHQCTQRCSIPGTTGREEREGERRGKGKKKTWTQQAMLRPATKYLKVPIGAYFALPTSSSRYGAIITVRKQSINYFGSRPFSWPEDVQ